MKNTKNNFIDSIGNTPLIKLKAASEITGCNIYGKAEYLNPGGSVKDRAALALIKDAQEKKLISEDFKYGLSWITELRPVTYRWDRRTWYADDDDDDDDDDDVS